MDPRSIPTPIPLEKTFDALVGIEYGRVEVDEVSATLDVREELLGAREYLHGGVIASTAEAMASLGTGAAVWEQGDAAFGMSINTTFLKEVKAGQLRFTARRVSDEPDRWTWLVEARAGDGVLCAVSTVSVAIRPRP